MKFLPNNRQFSEEEIVRDWSLSAEDKRELARYRKSYRIFIAVQFCSLRLFGRFLQEPNDLQPGIVSHLSKQLSLLPALNFAAPEREATWLEHRKNILEYLDFHVFDTEKRAEMLKWIENKATEGFLPRDLVPKVEAWLLANRVLVPAPTTIERAVVSTCARAHESILHKVSSEIPTEIKAEINKLLSVPKGEQHSYFQRLKEFPPSASISSLQEHIKKYQQLESIGFNREIHLTVDSRFINYLFTLAKSYKAHDLKRFESFKRHALVFCFLLEVRKTLLDQLVDMHDQYVGDLIRQSRNRYEQKHREMRKKQSKATDSMLSLAHSILSLPDNQMVSREHLLVGIGYQQLEEAALNLSEFKNLEESGLARLMIARYPSLRKYFADFIRLPFEASAGSEPLLRAIKVLVSLDDSELKSIPSDVSTRFVHRDLVKSLLEQNGAVRRNVWELSIAIAMKDALRSGDLFLAQSKQHVSFWNLVLSEDQWKLEQPVAYKELNQPAIHQVKQELQQQFITEASGAIARFESDGFATIENGKLKLKRDDRITLPPSVTRLQKLIDANMPSVRIEQLLMEVDRLTGFTRKFEHVTRHESRPRNFYKTLIASIISQATNLGVVAMSSSVNGITLDMLRHVLRNFVREETITAASGVIVDAHHKLPLSSIHGKGTISSSDAQRFKIRADSLLASYYPRYFGYYEKAIGIYTHLSDQSSVFGTKAISCGPREALYVLDGLLENNTILRIREHTTDTHGYTEIIFALCHLLGFYFMPRIRDLKDQQLYSIDHGGNYGIFGSLLTKRADMAIVEEQWDSMMRVVYSLKKRTTPAHVVMQRLTNSFPADRLSRAFTNLGRIIKTQYILRYLTDESLRRVVQIQLNKGEYRHKLPRWIFFANQGEFCTGDYEEIMNKASCLSLVSNAILHWNTIKIDEIVGNLRKQGEHIADEDLSHISLLPFKHVLPNGTYFIDEH
jgi:TnpA family transposase